MNQSKSNTDSFNNIQRQVSPVKSNPFDTYKSQASQHQQDPQSKVPYKSAQLSEQSNSTPRSHSSVSRSRSRDRQNPSQQLKDSRLQTKYQNQEKTSRKNQYGQGDKNISSGKAEQSEETYFKTKLCPLFEKGQCQKGSTCNFAHGQKQLRGLPNFRKTRLCIPFKNGQCPKATEDCKYAHGQGELRKLVYDYVPPKGHRGIQTPRYNRGEDIHSRDRQRRYNQYTRDEKRSRPRDRDPRQQESYRNYPFYREQRQHGHKDRHRDSRDRDRYRDRDRERGERDRGDHYNRGYQIKPSDVPPYQGYMAGYNGQYMVHPQMGGYGSDFYGMGGGMQNSNPNFSGSGSSYPPPASGGQYGYGYGYLPPHSYSSYGSV